MKDTIIPIVASMCFMHVFFSLTTFSGDNYFIATMAYCVFMDIVLNVGRDAKWKTIYAGIMASCFIAAIIGMINYHVTDNDYVVNSLYYFFILATIGELVILAMAANGKLGGHKISFKRTLGKHSLHTDSGKRGSRKSVIGSLV